LPYSAVLFFDHLDTILAQGREKRLDFFGLRQNRPPPRSKPGRQRSKSKPLFGFEKEADALQWIKEKS
jgi:hypothetical protein